MRKSDGLWTGISVVATSTIWSWPIEPSKGGTHRNVELDGLAFLEA